VRIIFYWEIRLWVKMVSSVLAYSFFLFDFRRYFIRVYWAFVSVVSSVLLSWMRNGETCSWASYLSEDEWSRRVSHDADFVWKSPLDASERLGLLFEQKWNFSLHSIEEISKHVLANSLIMVIAGVNIVNLSGMPWKHVCVHPCSLFAVEDNSRLDERHFYENVFFLPGQNKKMRSPSKKIYFCNWVSP
jgi:hypothetical protein